MKTIQTLFLLLTTSILLTSPVTAASVPALKSFTKGTPAVSADVNGNFNDIKTAVDDNDLRIKTLEKSTPGAGDLSVKLSGTVSVISNTNSVVGGLSGINQTFFTKELKVNTVISIDGQVNLITSIIDDNNLTIRDPQNSAVDNLPAFTDGDLLTLKDSAGQSKLKVDNTGALLFRKQALPITPVKMAFTRLTINSYSFTDVDGVESILSPTQSSNKIVISTSTIAKYDIDGNQLTTQIYPVILLNINASPSLSCTLLHNGFSSFSPYRITTDTGSEPVTKQAWGNSTTKTFMVMNTEPNLPSTETPIPVGSKFEIICF